MQIILPDCSTRSSRTWYYSLRSVLLRLGHTFVNNEEDLSSNTLTSDLIRLIDHILPQTDQNTQVPIILLGHSMGGGIAVHLAHEESLKKRVKGLIVIDVVEGSALESLHVMMNVLRKRPTQFCDIQEAIDWSVDSHLLLNRASAKISIPDQLVEKDGVWVWRTNLFQTKEFWKDWYTNMSQRYLDSPAIKMLFLAGRERLDTPLTIGQMQGKFQMILMNGIGHYMHEDSPEEVKMRYLVLICRLEGIYGGICRDITFWENCQRKRLCKNELNESAQCYMDNSCRLVCCGLF